MKRFLQNWILGVLVLVTAMPGDAGLIGISGSRGSASSGSLNIGSLSLDGYATPEQVALVLPVTGSLTTAATATCQYKRHVDVSYSTCHPLMRTRPSLSDSGGPTVTDVFAWPVIDLAQGTSYDFSVSVSDGTTTVVKTLTTSTRTLPVSSGSTTVTITAGSSAATIQGQINGAGAGAVVTFQDGTYTLSATLALSNSNGTPANPIYVRGTTRAGTILSKSSGNIIQLQTVDNIVFERMTLQGSGVDSGTGASSTAVSFFDGSVQDAITFRNMTFTGVDRGLGGDADKNEILVYNNTFTGNNTWTQDFYSAGGSGAPGAGDGTPDQKQNVFWNDDGIDLGGQGNAAWNNTITGFGDTFTVSFGTTTAVAKGVFFYRNDAPRSGDDLFEADYGFRNVAFYDNRANNVSTALSLDPLYSGPLLYARNIVINPLRTRWLKFNGQNVGYFLYNNTFVVGQDSDALNPGQAGMYLPSNAGPSQAVVGFRNNLTIYRGSSSKLLQMGQTVWSPIDWDHNGWYPDRTIDWSDSGAGSYANLAAAQSGLPVTTAVFSGNTHRMQSDIVVSSSAPFNETITLGTNALTEYTTAVTPTLSSGSNAKNAGVAIANITDGYSGGAPDLGASIAGRATVSYGDQSGASMTYISGMADYAVAAQSTVANGKTTISSVTPSEWNPPSGLANDQGLSHIMAYSGGGKAIIGRKMYIHGGGHNDSANNGMYVFDFDGTDKPTGWGTPVISTVASVQTTDPYSDGKPDSVHTYDDMVTMNGYVYRFQGSRYDGGSASGLYWRYNIATGVWSQLANNSNVYQYCTNRGSTIADAATDKIFFMMAESCGNYFYNATANTWSNSKSLSFTPVEYMSGVKGPGGEAIIVGRSQKSKLTINWSSETVSDTPYTTSGSSALYATDGPSAAYDSSRGVYWMWGGPTGSAGWSNIYELNLGTGVTTAHALSGTIPGGTRANGSWGGFVFSDTDRFIGVANDVAGSAYVIKLPP